MYDNPHNLTILALGPLTNLAKVIQKDPSALQKAKSIHTMGAAVAEFTVDGLVQVATSVDNQAFFEVFLNTIFPKHTDGTRLMFKKGMI